MAATKDHAIVLRLIDWSETSQITVLLTREHGKVSATVKGAKRQTRSALAKYSGGLELATLGEAVMIIRSGRDLANLIEWELVDGFWGLRGNLRAFELAMYAVDLSHHLLQDHDPHPRTFEGLAGFLSQLGGQTANVDGEYEPWLLQFQWRLIVDAGYRPTLDAGPGRTLVFSARRGGVVKSASDGWKVRRQTIELLQRLGGEQPIGDAEPMTLVRANRLLCAYTRAILDKQLPTMSAVLGRGESV
jgi:DNA repair protein RecO (recombination protein O)